MLMLDFASHVDVLLALFASHDGAWVSAPSARFASGPFGRASQRAGRLPCAYAKRRPSIMLASVAEQKCSKSFTAPGSVACTSVVAPAWRELRPRVAGAAREDQNRAHCGASLNDAPIFPSAQDARGLERR